MQKGTLKQVAMLSLIISIASIVIAELFFSYTVWTFYDYGRDVWVPVQPYYWWGMLSGFIFIVFLITAILSSIAYLRKRLC
jgi:hypothetical protein